MGPGSFAADGEMNCTGTCTPMLTNSMTVSGCEGQAKALGSDHTDMILLSYYNLYTVYAIYYINLR